MIDLKLTTRHDITLDEAGNFNFVTGAECVEQMIETALRLHIKEYEYNANLGISWQVAMSEGYAQVPVLQYQIQQAIYGLNNYIVEDSLKIINVEQAGFTFNQQRQLTLAATVTLANKQIVGVNVGNG